MFIIFSSSTLDFDHIEVNIREEDNNTDFFGSLVTVILKVSEEWQTHYFLHYKWIALFATITKNNHHQMRH